VPVLGLVTDEYTAVKQRGALAHWAQDAVVPIVAADSEGIARLQQLWSGRHAIAGAAAAPRAPRRCGGVVGPGGGGGLRAAHA
jgi:hypothetical protein